MTSYEEMREEEYRREEAYRKKEEQYQAFEHYLEHEASDETKKMVQDLEQDICKIMYLYGELIEVLVIKTSPMVENACANSAFPLIVIANGLGSLFQEIEAITRMYIFVEDERDAMQEKTVELFASYIEQHIEQFFAYLDLLSVSPEANEIVSLVAIDPELKKILRDEFNTVFLITDPISQELFITMLSTIKKEVPHIRIRVADFLNDMLLLKQNVDCDSETFIRFVDCRLQLLGGIERKSLEAVSAEHMHHFASKEIEDFTHDDLAFAFDLGLNAANLWKEIALEEYKKRN